MKELSNEARILIAFLASMLILVGWSYFFAPQTPPQPPQPEATEQPVTPPEQPAAAQPTPAQQQAPGVSAPAQLPTMAASQERLLAVENGLYRVTFSNRGAVVRGWQLQQFRDDSDPPRTLDLVHPEAAQVLGAWPLSFLVDDKQLEQQLNEALFLLDPEGYEFRAPAELAFRWSDGRVAASKEFRFTSSYVVEISSTVSVEGRPVPHALAWRSGFGDVTAPGGAALVKVFYRSGTEMEKLDVGGLGTPDAPAQPQRLDAGVGLGGIEDRYFVAAFLPHPDATGPYALWHWRREREFIRDGEPVKDTAAELAVGAAAEAPLSLRLYVGPKDLDTLSALRPSLEELVDFGWFGFIARPLFYFLKWIHGFLPNYGWAIVLMTLVVNMALFPLKVKSFRSMQKMQRIMPEIKQIKEKYKKYGMRDPRKQQEQVEMQALMKRSGVNPMGGCLPMVLQMPIWFALYQMLNTAIELRHAPWIGWVQDLSVRDPYYILPIFMTLTMYLTMKMTPATSPDPMQQKIMSMMPIMMGFLFLTISSGLVLYILTSNLVGMAQQWYLMRGSSPAEKPPRGGKGKKKA